MTEGWKYRRLDELGGKKRPVLKAGPFGSAVTKDIYVDAGFKVYGQQEVVSGDINAERYYISPEAFRTLKSCEVEAGDILITMMGTVGRLWIIPEGAEPGIINPRLMRISLNKAVADPVFVCAFLGSSQIQRLLERRAHGGTMQGLNADALGSLSVPLPPLPEQCKIAKILGTWDATIEKCGQLIRIKTKRYNSLANSLFGEKLRCTTFTKKWREIRLSYLTTELTARNRDGRLGRDRVMGVTKATGIVPMREQTIGEDIEDYKVLPPNGFAYNPMRINVGSIAMWRGEGDVLISPAYMLFKCVEGKLDPNFLDHFRRTHYWDHYINAGGSGSVRVRVYYDDLAAIKINLPDYREQVAIAAVLDAAAEDIRVTERLRDALQRQKRGLMQKLLTGQWRVKV